MVFNTKLLLRKTGCVCVGGAWAGLNWKEMKEVEVRKVRNSCGHGAVSVAPWLKALPLQKHTPLKPPLPAE